MHIMTRVSSPGFLKLLSTDGEFIPCLPFDWLRRFPKAERCSMPCAPIDLKNTSAIFPQENLILSYGSGLWRQRTPCGRNVWRFRIASAMAQTVKAGCRSNADLRLTSAEGETVFISPLPFPSAAAKTNLADDATSIPGWKCECIGGRHWPG